MKKFLIMLLVIVFIPLAGNAQDNITFRKVGTITIAGTTTGSLAVPIFSPDEWSNSLKSRGTDYIRIPERHEWGIYLYTKTVSLSTAGNIDVTYDRMDWDYNVEDSTATSLATTWSWTDLGYRIFDVTQDVPVPFVYVTVERTSGDGTAAFEIWVTYR